MKTTRMAIGEPPFTYDIEQNLKLAETSSRAIRVCHVSLSLKTGGLERILAGMASHTNRDQCHMDFIALKDEGRFADEIRRSGAKVTTLNCTNRWSMMRQLRRCFRQGHYDVVHTHNTYPHLYATIAARWAGIPVVLNTRHGQRAGHGWKSRTLFRWVSRWADQIVAVSDDAARLCVEIDGLPPSKVTRIWNGIDTNDFSVQNSSHLPNAVTVGRLAPEKDLKTLLQAMAIAILRIPGLKLKIVGDGALRSELESLASALKLERVVEFAGEQHNVADSLRGCGFYVSSTLTEGISLTILEAMAVGLPVVATRVGGNPEIIVEGTNGLLVEPANPNELAEGICKMWSRSEQWQSMGLSARERVVQCFEVKQMVANYEKLYHQLLRARRS